MKTDITSGISGAAGTSLAHQAIQSGRDSAKRDTKIKSSETISDTLETTDREGDGRQTWNVNSTNVERQTGEGAADEGGIDLVG